MQLIRQSNVHSDYEYFVHNPTTDYLSATVDLRDILYSDVSLGGIRGVQGLKGYYKLQDDYKVIIPHFDWPLTIEFIQQNYPELLL